MSEKTHWKKNLDSRYISGEDLKSGLKGLKSPIHVEVIKFDADAEVYDQNTNSKKHKSALFLKEIDGEKLHKPVLLNKTNALFFVGLTGKEFLDDWVGAQATMFAQPDRRHGHVVRFKKYTPPRTVKPEAAIKALGAAKTLDELKQIWGNCTADEKKHPEVLKKKEDMKTQIEAK